jgi:hypothetical protein
MVLSAGGMAAPASFPHAAARRRSAKVRECESAKVRDFAVIVGFLSF